MKIIPLDVKNLIALNQIKDAISFLSEHFGQSELGNQIHLVSSRFHELENLRLNNFIKLEEYILESNKLRFSILELCDNIPMKNEPTTSEIDELVKLLQYRAQKINEAFDSVDFRACLKILFCQSGHTI